MLPECSIHAVAWDDPEAVRLRAAQRVEIEQRYGTPDSEPGPAPTADDIAVFLLARSPEGAGLGCGGLRLLGAGDAEVKRMYVEPAARGTGVATAVLRALEAEARTLGVRVLKLETGDRQPDAIRFYTREGYMPVPPFGHYVDSVESRCFARELA